MKCPNIRSICALALGCDVFKQGAHGSGPKRIWDELFVLNNAFRMDQVLIAKKLAEKVANASKIDGQNITNSF